MSSNVVTKDLVFTAAAANKVAELICEEEDYGLNLRVYITGGGCSGFQYGFTFDKDIKDDDIVITREVDLPADKNKFLSAVKLLIDPLSYQYLQGAEIDYREGLNGAQFVIRNPNAQTTCGCGSSFSV